MTELEKLRAALDVAALAADYDTISDAYAAYLAAYPDALEIGRASCRERV
jgi:hypothetical protein